MFFSLSLKISLAQLIYSLANIFSLVPNSFPHIFSCHIFSLAHNPSHIIIGHQKRSFIKKIIGKGSYPKYTTTHPLKACYCNGCVGKLVDPRTRKAHNIRKDIIGVTRDYHDAIESSNKTIITSSKTLSKKDILEELPDMNIYEETMLIDSSDNDSVVSSYKNDFSFIAKSQSKKGKRPVRNGGKRSAQNLIFVENLFSDEEENVTEDLLDDEDEKLIKLEIDFDTSEDFIGEMEEHISILDVLKGFLWIIL